MIEKEKVARPEGIEPPTLCLEGRCSIQLSYGRINLILNALEVEPKHFFLTMNVMADTEARFTPVIAVVVRAKLL